MSEYEDMMEGLALLGDDASMYLVAIDGEGGTEGDLQRRKENSTDLFDRFFSTLLINDVTLEEYSSYWRQKNGEWSSCLDGQEWSGDDASIPF